MADNTTINSMSGGDVIATDDIGGVKHQRVKVGFGVDGSYADVSRTSQLPVDIAPATTATSTTVAASATTVQLLASNTSRKGMIIRNDGAATLYVGLGVAATSARAIEVPPGESVYDIPASYRGVVNGIWSSATGNARIEELT